MNNDGGSLDYVADALDILDASCRDYILVVSHGSSFVVNGNIDRSCGEELISMIRSGAFKRVIQDISQDE